MRAAFEATSLACVSFGCSSGSALKVLFQYFDGDPTIIATCYHTVHDPVNRNRALESDRPLGHNMYHTSYRERRLLARFKIHTGGAHIAGGAVSSTKNFAVLYNSKFNIEFYRIALALTAF